MWFLRRILRVSWTERKTNEEVMCEAEYKRSILNTIYSRQLKFFGHVMRRNTLEKCLMLGKIIGKKSRGRQRTKFTDGLNKIAQKRNINSTIDLIRRSECRDDWRAMIIDVCNRPDT